jgi:lipid A 3-O-deacylase
MKGSLLLSALMHSPTLTEAECQDQTAPHPADRAEWAVETGYLWNVGDNTPIDYEIVPTQLVYRSHAILDWFAGANGSRLVVRNRFALLIESIVEGPEDYYAGVSAAPSIEYWFPNRQTSAYFSIGGGVGAVNATDVPGGQGQDFTFNWFSQLGLRQEIARNISLLGGIYFLHHSNGGQTSPNPGIDALGFTVGAGWTF